MGGQEGCGSKFSDGIKKTTLRTSATRENGGCNWKPLRAGDSGIGRVQGRAPERRP
jgi:hypothetical protein